MVDKIIEYISIFLALMLVLPVHEFAHGFAAVKSGDNTPKFYNRYTLYPLAHFDFVGLVCFAFLGIGWAKPMPVNPRNFKHYKRGCFFVSIAGVLANYLLAFVTLPLFVLAITYVPQFGYFTTVLVQTLYFIYTFSLVFSIFNLIPVYPLDGFRLLDVFNKKHGKVYMFLRNYGLYILYGLFFLGILADLTNIYQLDILGRAISYLKSIIEIPITKFWGLFF